MTTRPHVLLVEDDPGDVLIAREALETHERSISVVNDGEQALAYLRGQDGYDGSVRPDLILLDLNIPRIDGHGVLAAVKADPELLDIPIVMLSTSDAETDVAESYRLHANAYVKKPNEYQVFVDVLESIDNFFCRVVRLPHLT
jgi:CheY-like chemotaxis protein